jgi:adsorption protein B
MTARYFLLHDRKGVVTSFVSIAAYVLLVQFLVLQAGAAAGWWPQLHPQLWVPGSAWMVLAGVNVAFLANRAVQRAWFCGRLYGWRHALLSLPRMVIGNFINCMAVSRAWRLYIVAVVLGRKLAWDKTAHDFPETDPASGGRQRIGELLQTWRAVHPEHLAEALEEHGRTQVPLGQVLVARGWLDEDTLAEAIACQADLPRAAIDADDVRRDMERLPAALMLRLRIVALPDEADGVPVVATAVPLADAALAELALHLGATPLQRIARDGEIGAALALVSKAEALPLPVAESTLAEIVTRDGMVDRDAYESAVRDYRPEQHGTLGELLVEQGVILGSMIQEAARKRSGAVSAPA